MRTCVLLRQCVSLCAQVACLTALLVRQMLRERRCPDTYRLSAGMTIGKTLARKLLSSPQCGPPWFCCCHPHPRHFLMPPHLLPSLFTAALVHLPLHALCALYCMALIWYFKGEIQGKKNVLPFFVVISSWRKKRA